MSNKILEELGVVVKDKTFTLRKELATGTVENTDFKFSLYLVTNGIEIMVNDNQKSCLISFESMLNIAQKMGLFEKKEKTNE